MIKKVLAYIIRNNEGNLELLVHRHRDFPEAGVQVPAGSVEEGEPLEKALYREIEEETGVSSLKLIKKLEEYPYYNTYKNELQERHVFLLQITKQLPVTWEHVVCGDGEDTGMVFICYWIPIENSELSGEMGKSLRLLADEIFLPQTLSDSSESG